MREQELDASWPAAEGVVVCVDGRASAQHLVRRAWRMATGAHAPLTAVFVETAAWAGASPERRNAVQANLRFAEDLGAEVVRVQADDVARAVLKVAHDKNAGSIVIGHSSHGRLHELFGGSIVHRLLRLARDVDVHVVADRG
jgi:two-component system sensor histidine kinase KdpD